MRQIERVMVWSGGVLFAGALVLCAFTYLVVFSRAGEPQGWPPLLIDTALLGVFAVHHSLFAREHVKRAIAAVIPPHLLRSFYVWIASALFGLVCLLWQPVGGLLFEAHGARAAAHLAAQIAGVWLIAKSVAAIDALELAGIRPPSAAGDLQVGGPYHFVRHPLYLGWILLVFATPRMTGDRMLFAVVTTAYLVVAIPWEERSLAGSFGDAYARYKQAVRWRLIPFIY
jgi:methanethiol S-methyltransferase